ncbi:MAG: hypothetical protein QG588_995 [Candidatus Poribacteria bacterium]|nr:hypothetical protein [Candidatus Poribacteria bacterium]
MVKKQIIILFISVLIGLCFISSAFPQAAKLIARWPLDETAGNTIKDAVGKNDGKLTGGPGFVQANFGNGLKFTKTTGQYVEIEKADELELADSLTAMVWVNVTSSAGRQEIFCYGDSFVIHIDAGVFKAYIHQGGAFPRAPGKTPVETNKWYFLAATYDSKELKLYVDGELDGSAKLPGGIAFLGLPLRFSNNPAAPAEAWGVQGIMDEVEMWDKPMTAEEIKIAYESPLYFLAVNSMGKLASAWGNLKR